ncbi:hypothetical protein L1987_54397 [Smallanthus sonchifolius]|uniref:Uncharacterized protein n=1 Tax=Smallanthus sonchifolius TaxID=185202 RepID=A0ACB9E7F6_9ASTR|nr:hypothetical protein L1987_54397 [Smallanthus sonchifolius]
MNGPIVLIYFNRSSQNHQKFHHDVGGFDRSRVDPNLGVNGRIHYASIPSGVRQGIRSRPPFGQGGFSLKDAVLRNAGSSSRGRKSVVVDQKISLLLQHCFHRSIVGEAIDILALCNSRIMLAKGGFSNVAISYIGGLRVLFTFKEPHLSNEFMMAKEGVWKDSLASDFIWIGQDIPFDRIACLKVEGVPFMLRDALLGRRIEDELDLRWSGSSYRVWVSEEMDSWAPIFQSFDKVMEESSSASVDVEEEMEEGEIRLSSSPVTAPTSSSAEKLKGLGHGESGLQGEVDSVHGDGGGF